MRAHGSGRFGFGDELVSGLAQHRPLDIGAQLLAPDRVAFLPGQPLDDGAALGRHFPSAAAPLVDEWRCHVEEAGQLGLPSDDCASAQDWRTGDAHAVTVAQLQHCCKAMLHCSLGSIAAMATQWTQEQEAQNLERLFAGVNQAAFAREFNVPGGASMLSQHIKGRRPINMDAALAYAKGFGLKLADISPRLAGQMSKALRDLAGVNAADSTAVNQPPTDAVRSALTLLTELLTSLSADRRDVIAGLMSGLAKDPANPVYAAAISGLLDAATPPRASVSTRPTLRGTSIFGELDEFPGVAPAKRHGSGRS